MSSGGGNFQLECDAFVCVELVFTHKNGSVSYYTEDFNVVCSVGKLKEDMAAKLAVPVEHQVWTFKGEVIKDNQTLDDVQVDPDDVIEVTSTLASADRCE